MLNWGYAYIVHMLHKKYLILQITDIGLINQSGRELVSESASTSVSAHGLYINASRVCFVYTKTWLRSNAVCWEGLDHLKRWEEFGG